MARLERIDHRPTSRRARRQQVMIVSALSVMVLVGLFPYLFMLITSFKTNAQFNASYWAPAWPLHLENYGRAWEQIRPYLVTSVIVAAASIALALVAGSIAATAFARYRFAGRKLLIGLVGVLMLIPGIASLIPLFVLMRDLGLVNTLGGLVVPMAVGGSVLCIVLMANYIRDIPEEIFEAATIDGAGGLRSFVSMVLPLSRPVIGSVMLLTVINVWNDFFWPAIIITDNDLRTVPVGLQFFRGQNLTEWGPQFAGYLLASLPLLLLFTFLSRQFLAGISGGISVHR